MVLNITALAPACRTFVMPVGLANSRTIPRHDRQKDLMHEYVRYSLIRTSEPGRQSGRIPEAHAKPCASQIQGWSRGELVPVETAPLQVRAKASAASANSPTANPG